MREKIIAPVLLASTLFYGCASGGGQENEANHSEAVSEILAQTPVSAVTNVCEDWPVMAEDDSDAPVQTNYSDYQPLSDESAPAIVADYFSDSSLEVINPGYVYDGLNSVSVILNSERMHPVEQAVVDRVMQAVIKVDEDGQDVGSGFIGVDSIGDYNVITAGHVLEDVVPEDLELTLNDGTDVQYDYYTYAFNDPWGSDLTIDEKGALSEDLGVISPCYDEGLADRALPIRNPFTNPLKIGETLLMINFQDKHQVGDPAVYQMPFMGESVIDPLFGWLVGDVQPGVAEDDLRPGGSGGVVTDVEGNIVGISTASVNKYNEPELAQWYQCGEIVSSTDKKAINGVYDLHANIILPETGDECDRGISTGSFRLADGTGYFSDNDLVESVLKVNPNS